MNETKKGQSQTFNRVNWFPENPRSSIYAIGWKNVVLLVISGILHNEKSYSDVFHKTFKRKWTKRSQFRTSF